MFELIKKPFKLTSVNPRGEHHGEDVKLAVDLKFSGTMANSVLDMFDDELREMLFKRKPAELEDLADQGTDEEYLSEIRFPYLQEKLKWKYKGEGYRLVVPYGIDEKTYVYMINTKLEKFEFEPKEGGSVGITFNVSGLCNGEEIGRLCELLLTECEITLEPPSAEERAQMELDAQRDEDDEEEAA